MDYKEKLIQLLNSKELTKEEEERLCEIFPELAESEDEKTRKWIRKELESKYVVDNIVNNEMADKALAWLEKQGEQKPTQEIEPFEAEHGKYYYCIKDYFCGGKKQASKGNVVQALRGLPIMGLKDASEYFLPVNYIKCNFAWSEEDKEKLNRIYMLLPQCIDCHPRIIGDKECVELQDWLKSLKDRVQPQLKQEWSEENKSYLLDFTRWFEQKAKAYDINLPMRGFDICAFCKEIIERLRICENLVWENIDETQRTNAIIMLKEGARRVYTKDSIDKCVDWLKSLRPQSQWKPSDEQMSALDDVISSRDIKYDVLSELWKDLKKLMEE